MPNILHRNNYILRLEMHGFADASEKAYGAVLYLRCLSAINQSAVNLLCSKSRVASFESYKYSTLESTRCLIAC